MVISSHGKYAPTIHSEFKFIYFILLILFRELYTELFAYIRMTTHLR